MCGIAGIYDPEGAAREPFEALIWSMGNAIAHRGPDAGTIWADAPVGLGFAHRRLAIQDLSEAGAQPMHSACGRYVLCYNGEVFNGAEIAAELRPLGHSFRGHSDTEAILAGFAEWGVEATLPRMVGQFAFALWDREERELTLVRDRLGIKPLYWTLLGGRLVFASELKALLLALPAPPAISRAGLATYLEQGFITGDLSIYEGVHKLEPGCLLRWRAGQAPEITRFWDLEDVLTGISPADRITDPGEAKALIEARLGEAVRCRLVSDVPIGAFLSGGMDSSLITALMQEASPEPIHTYSIGSPDDAYDEARYARKIAAHLGTKHTELEVDDAACLAEIPRLAEVYDEPFGDASMVPTLVLSRLARQHVTVALSGDGGDEGFAGYNRHLWLARLNQIGRYLPGWTRGCAAAAVSVMPPALGNFLGRLIGKSEVGRRLERLERLLRTKGPEDAHRAAIYRWRGLGGPMPEHRAYPMSRRLGQFTDVERMLAIDMLTFLPEDILTKVDRASMAHALEVRVPFLDHRVVAAAFQIDSGLKMHGATTKWLLRQMLFDRFPRELIERPKMGFSIPIDNWLRGPLKDWAAALIDETDWQGALGIDPAPIRTAWAEHGAKRGNHADKLWSVLMLAEWEQARPK